MAVTLKFFRDPMVDLPVRDILQNEYFFKQAFLFKELSTVFSCLRGIRQAKNFKHLLRATLTAISYSALIHLISSLELS
jgi:hypothetical protein